MVRIIWRSILVMFCAVAAVRATEPRPPDQIAVDGAGDLRLVAQAQRTHRLGTVDVYGLAIYINAAMELDRLASEDVAKAIRIHVTWIDDLRRRTPLDWRRELLPHLEPAAVNHLRSAFAPLRHGDIVQIEYAPGKGTSVRVNKAIAVSGGGHDLMLAFLDHWLGQRPVSER